MEEEEDIPVGWPQDTGYGWAIVFGEQSFFKIIKTDMFSPL